MFLRACTLGAFAGGVMTPFCLSRAAPTTEGASSCRGQTARDVLDTALDAMGGVDVLGEVAAVTLSAPNIFRSQTLTQTYNLHRSDVFLATGGAQNISFNYASGRIQQSIDRTYSLSDYWIWAVPTLDPPVSFSLKVQDGPGGFAWFAEGSNSIVSDPTENLGYADPGLAEYLTGEAERTEPLLVYHMAKGDKTECVDIAVNGLTPPAVYDSVTNLTVAFDPETNLPWFVRREEYNQVFGAATNDLYLTDYRPVNSSSTSKPLMLPHRYQTVYNGVTVLEDTIFEAIHVNPSFPAGFFDAHMDPNSKNPTPNSTLITLDSDPAEVAEFYNTGLWSGEFVQMYDQVNATHPIESLPQLWHLGFTDRVGDESGYTQLVIEMGGGVLVADAPHHLSKIVIQWVKDNLNKPITHLWPSHHHHDHAYGSADYVAAGAKMVVPEVARDYWSHIPNVELVTFDDHTPFTMADDNVQVRAIWRPNAPHAEDWSWLVVTKACPSEEDQMVIFEADVWNPDDENVRSDIGFSREWLQWLNEEGVRNNTIVTACHGGTMVLQNLIDVTGYAYPPHRLNDFKVGGDLCVVH